MIFLPVVSLLLASFAPAAYSQDIVYDAVHNATSIVGTWSSGSRAVQTGSGFANPANFSFFYPKTTGVSFSFSADGFFEVARYRFNGNGSEPTCITGIMNWIHGKYTLNNNGSITLEPFNDGYQQIQDPCAAVSNFIEDYNRTEIYTSWRIFQDATQGYKLHLFQFNGAPVAPQFQVSVTPNMLPTQQLRNLPKNDTSNPKKRGLVEVRTTSDALDNRRWKSASLIGGGLTAVGVVMSVL